MKYSKHTVLAAFVLSSAACATVTKGTGDDVTFTSSPSGAKVTASDLAGKEIDQSCLTPCQLELNRKWNYAVTFEKEGYQTFESRLDPELSTDGAVGMAGNIFVGGVIGAAVDGSTGAMNDLKPNPLNAVLTPKKGSGGSENEQAAELAGGPVS